MKKILSNGKEIVATPADFVQSLNLQAAVIAALQKTDLGIGKVDVSKILESEFDVEKLLKAALHVSFDQKVLEAFWECARKALVGNDLKMVSMQFFEPEENRELFPEIFLFVLEANLKGFFIGIRKMLASIFRSSSPAAE